MTMVANVSLSLSCVAHGPPEPVRVIWLQDGAPLNSLSDPVALSPSTLNLTGSGLIIPQSPLRLLLLLLPFHPILLRLRDHTDDYAFTVIVRLISSE